MMKEREVKEIEILKFPVGKRCLILFREFFLIASFVVGGGFAILLVTDELFTKKYRVLRDGELNDMLAIIQTVPGLTAGNVAVYAGYRVAGFAGALSALAGVAAPSFLVITLVSIWFSAIPMENVWIQGAFLGVRTAMTGLMLVTMAKIWRGAVRCRVQLSVCLLGSAGVLVFHWNPGWLILGGILFGILWCAAGKPLPEEPAENAGKSAEGNEP